MLEGGAAYARLGTPDSTGTRLFCLSGAVRRPGVYEVEHGTTLGALLELAGVCRSRRDRKRFCSAAQPAVSSDATRSRCRSRSKARAPRGATLGSGVVAVFDRSTAMMPLLQRIARFFRDESCGQCVPCRIGTVRQEEALRRVILSGAHGAAVEGRRSDVVTLLDDVARAMRDASICGLGQTAANAIASARELAGVFPEAAQ